MIVVCVVAVLLALGTAHGKICHEIDVRNTYDHIANWTDCTVITGYLRILLIERNNTQYTEKSPSFSKLVEIRGYLLVYRAHGLKSLAPLFPSLAVISGDDLFENYAIVLYENPDLEEIGLYKLSKITRGGIRVEKCDKICYVDTIDWKAIGAQKHNINKNRDCECPSSCPGGHCWNEDHCQFISNECHEQCIGCSAPHSNTHCYACMNVKDHNKCVSRCPSNKFAHVLTKECLTATECKNSEDGWWTFNGQCIKECPSGYKEVSKEEGMCQPCKGHCVKYCDGALVNSMASAQRLTECTHINGNLHLQINSTELASELNKTLNYVEEISGYLKVVRSNSLTSLDFLNNMKVINGTTLDDNMYAIVVHLNENLHKLWDFNENSTLSIKNGTISFHNNPQLCKSEITTLARIAGLNYNKKDISPSNGDRSACNTIHLSINITENNPTNVTLQWEKFKQFNSNDTGDALVGYYVYYIENEEDKNITIYDGREICQGGGWDSIFTTKTYQQITGLKPSTNYSYYIKTYVTKLEGDRSQIQYFKTQSDDPTECVDVEATATSSSSIYLTWKQPELPNGEISHYSIAGMLIPDDQDLLDRRNYCNLPMKPTVVDKKPKKKVEEVKNTTDCECESNREMEVDDETKRLQDYEKRFKNLCTESETILLFSQEGSCQDFQYRFNETDIDYYYKRKRELLAKYKYLTEIEMITENNVTEYQIDNLKHYSLYAFYIAACNKLINKTMKCGSVYMVVQRTLKKEDADDIPSGVIVEQKNEHTHVKWYEPTDPNSVILAYEVDFTTGNSKNHECVTRKAHRSAGFVYRRKFLPGSYVIKVRAVSLAGPGRTTEPMSFEVSSGSKLATVLIIMAVFLVSGFCMVIGYYIYYRRRQEQRNMHLITSVNPDYAEYVVDEWEMDRSRVVLNRELGKGTFGMVYAGIIDNDVPCAVKTVNGNANAHQRMDFLNEANVMKRFSDAHHVVKLLGVVSIGEPALVVMELMELGDLKSYLRSSRDSPNPITSAEVYRMAIEVADGMTYLSAKKYVHRDLAARNCMVSHDKTVKVGDFGMTRDIYETDYYRKESKGLLPVRWMAPESLADGVFTTDSDVWSYGVILWEIATLGEQPYQGMSNDTVFSFIITKGKPELPRGEGRLPEILHDIMESCWKWRPIDRPTFADIVDRLQSHVGQNFMLVSFYHSRDGEDYRLNAGPRVYNPPAVEGNHPETSRAQRVEYNPEEEEVCLYPGEEPATPPQQSTSFLPFPYQRC